MLTAIIQIKPCIFSVSHTFIGELLAILLSSTLVWVEARSTINVMIVYRLMTALVLKERIWVQDSTLIMIRVKRR